MKIHCLGNSGALALGGKDTNFIVEYEGNFLVIDMGTTWFQTLPKHINPLEIDHVFISHLHADHAGGLEKFAFLRYVSAYPKPVLLGNSDFAHHVSRFLHEGTGMFGGKAMDLHDYFHVASVTGPSRCVFGPWEVGIRRTRHVQGPDGQWMEAYSIVVGNRYQKEKILFTCDCRFGWIDESALDEATLIFHDCMMYEIPINDAVHPMFSSIKECYPAEIKSKILLCHYGDVPDIAMLKDAGILGCAEAGQCYEV